MVRGVSFLFFHRLTLPNNQNGTGHLSFFNFTRQYYSHKNKLIVSQDTVLDTFLDPPVNTDNHTEGGEELTRQVEAVVEEALGRFSDRITRVEVHLTDENSSSKCGDNDKRCVMEARLAGRQPITVTDQGATLEQALDGAADKPEKTLKRSLGRLDEPKGRTRATALFPERDSLSL